MSGHAEYINSIDYNGKPVNMMRFLEEKVINGETVRKDFQWITSIRITKKRGKADGSRQETLEDRERGL